MWQFPTRQDNLGRSQAKKNSGASNQMKQNETERSKSKHQEDNTHCRQYSQPANRQRHAPIDNTEQNQSKPHHGASHPHYLHSSPTPRNTTVHLVAVDQIPLAEPYCYGLIFIFSQLLPLLCRIFPEKKNLQCGIWTANPWHSNKMQRPLHNYQCWDEVSFTSGLNLITEESK